MIEALAPGPLLPMPFWVPTFLSPLRTEYIDGRNWKVIDAFIYETTIIVAPYGPLIITIPAGFITDFASTPRFLWPVLSPTGPWGKPSVVHDFLYRTKGLATKDQADRVFLEAMTALGVNRATRQIMYRGVKWFGSHSYKGGLN